MDFIEKLKNYLKGQKIRHQSRDYAVLLEEFGLEDEKLVNQIFKQLKNSPISIIASNGGSKEWNFIISWEQTDNLDYSNSIADRMSPALAKFGLKIKKVWPE